MPALNNYDELQAYPRGFANFGDPAGEYDSYASQSTFGAENRRHDEAT